MTIIEPAKLEVFISQIIKGNTQNDYESLSWYAKRIVELAIDFSIKKFKLEAKVIEQ